MPSRSSSKSTARKSSTHRSSTGKSRHSEALAVDHTKEAFVKPPDKDIQVVSTRTDRDDQAARDAGPDTTATTLVRPDAPDAVKEAALDTPGEVIIGPTTEEKPAVVVKEYGTVSAAEMHLNNAASPSIETKTNTAEAENLARNERDQQARIDAERQQSAKEANK